MKQGAKNILTIRSLSCAFVVLALAVFKPFGLEAWQWQGVGHLLMIFIFGVIVCLFTDVIIDKVLKRPQSLSQDPDYIIRRNLWFQIINTPLIALMICLYRHFAMSDLVEGNRLSLSNFLETLLIIAFCSFAIGLYWRFKFRSKYLAAELEETRLMNEQLKTIQQQAQPDDQQPEEQPETITLTGSTNESVTLKIAHLLYIEAVGNYVKVYHLHEGQVKADMLRATSKQMEDELSAYPMIVRCHRAFLVNLAQVEQIISHSGTTQLQIRNCHESLPVSRSNMAQIKAAIILQRQ